MLRLNIFVSAVVFLSIYSAFAQVKVDTRKKIRLEYASKAWNKSPSVVDSGNLVLRDVITKKIARIEVTESAENSGMFVGYYSLSWGERAATPEIYLAPQSLGTTNDQLAKIEELIQSGTLTRKPFFIRSEGKDLQAITVYDNKDQAIAAYDEYRRLRMDKVSPDRAALEAQAKANRDNELQALLEANANNEADRQRLETLETKRLADLKNQFSSLGPNERARRQKAAKDIAAEGLKLYQESKYPEASEKFSKAADLDPKNSTFYYQYGVCLYKIDKYNQSLVTLKLAQGGDINPVERNYYIGLNYLRLKDLDRSLTKMNEVKAANDKSLSPSSGFFSGIIYFQKENYDSAKAEFEYVLDQSSDPALDRQAEAYIEQIANVMAFKKEQQKKFILSASLGLIYDSNILSVSNSQVDGNPTDLEGYRWTYGGTVEYRSIYTTTREFSAVLAVSDMYSTDKNMAAYKEFQNTDPLVINVTLPYKLKGKALGKPYQGSVTPGTETIYMNADTQGEREAIVYSYFLQSGHTFVMSDDWFSTYSLEIRKDNSLLALTSADDNQTAMKYTLSTAQTFFQDAKKTRAWIGEVGYSINSAEGANSRYNRYDLGVTYMAPWVWNMSWSGKLGYYNANYSDHTTGRVDKDTSVTLGLRKPLTESMALSLSGVYTINDSTLSSSDYRKYMITTGFSWTGSL